MRIPTALLVATAAFLDPYPLSRAQTAADGPPREFPLEVRTFAGSTDVGHPIGLSVADDGRVFVAETRRYTVGVKQSRGDQELEDLELQAESVAAFEDVLRAQVAKGKFRRDEDKANDDPEFCFHGDLSEEVARYVDADGDGAADERTVFADGFDRWYSGPAADVMVDGDDVWLANVPDLWKLTDRDGDGRARGDEKHVVHTGLGVVFSFLGHDLHGLVRGPDGRVYFSIGDRSFHVVSREGRTYSGKTGAVFRMNPDGTDLERFAVGLRNPQDLAFTAWGDLWTGDNNCDKGDRARIVHVVEGSDQGWRLSVQRAASGGTWLREKTWWSIERVRERLGLPDAWSTHKNAARPAWVLPPIHHPKGQGPSGAFEYPGVGLPARYDDHAFLTHCAGGGGFIQAFALRPDGAALVVRDFHTFVGRDVVVGPSDAEFGPDGKIYSTDWGSGWDPNDDAKIVTIAHAASLSAPVVAEVRTLLHDGFAERSNDRLATLLGHVDARVRRRAQFELAARGDSGRATLRSVAVDGTRPEIARMHGVWGVAQSVREEHVTPDADLVDTLIAGLTDGSARVRERCAEACGDLRLARAAGALIERLSDDDARVRHHAANALGKLGDTAARAPLVALLEENDDRDLVLRHGTVTGLAGVSDDAFLVGLVDHARPAVRLGAVLALRARSSPGVARFLGDPDLLVATEAARAVYDGRHVESFAALAGILDRDPPREVSVDTGEGSLRRALAASVRLGGAAQARRLLRFAALPSIPVEFRLAALESFDAFDDPGPKEPVWFDWWPVPPRPAVGRAEIWRDALASGLLARISAGGETLRARVFELSSKLLPPRPTEELLARIADESENVNVRLDAFEAALSREDEDAGRAIQLALASADDALRRAALEPLCERTPLDAMQRIEVVLRTGTTRERQEAISALPRFSAPRARYVRVAQFGADRILSLAELRVTVGGENVAPLGVASQSSVAWDGPPELAIDGSIFADHSVEPAVTHTAIENDPWWELDLGREMEVEALTIFNRTDGGHHRRLDGAVVTLLGADRAERWRTTLDPAPETSVELRLGTGGLAGVWADRILSDLTRALANGTADADVAVEIVEAARARNAAHLERDLEHWRTRIANADPLGEWSLALAGGDPVRGEEIFRYDAVAQCLRCHSDQASGGNVGPDLVGVGRRRDSRFLTRSLVAPQADLTPGFGSFSAMPGISETHSPRDVRDLVAFLSTLTEGEPAPPPTIAAPEAAPAPPPAAGATPRVSFLVRGIAWFVLGLLALLLLLLLALRRPS